MAKQDVIKQFTALKSIGKAKAELLYDNGLDSLVKLKKASVKELTKLKGINEAFAKELLAQLKDKEPATKASPKKKAAAKPKAEKKPAEKKKAPAKKKTPAETEEKKPAPKKEEKQEKEVEIVEEGEEKYKVKKKPELSKELKEKLQTRRKIKKRTPEFLREEWFRYKRIPKNWRRPDGITSKMRINLKYRPSKVRVGFRGPKEVRGLHSSGFEEVIVYNVHDLEGVDPKTQAARIGGTVGTKKRIEIEKKAEELDVRILNM